MDLLCPGIAVVSSQEGMQVVVDLIGGIDLGEKANGTVNYEKSPITVQHSA